MNQIGFNSEMLDAVLSGRKTQTRRVITPQPPEEPENKVGPDKTRMHPAPYLDAYCSEMWSDANPRGMSDEWLWWTPDNRACFPRFKCPYGKPGDVLEVKGHPNVVLLVKAIRIERLQAISESDAMAEGVDPLLVSPDGGSTPHVEGFRELWTSIYGPDAWDANPLVWVIEFKREEATA